MSMYLAASMLAAQLAAAPEETMPDESVGRTRATPAFRHESPPPQAPKIPEDWSAAPPPSRVASAAAVRELIAAENTERAASGARPANTLRAGKQDSLEARFDEARVPNCLHADGLKRQPTSIGPFGVSGYLALPFVIVAKLRGKCK